MINLNMIDVRWIVIRRIASIDRLPCYGLSVWDRAYLFIIVMLCFQLIDI